MKFVIVGLGNPGKEFEKTRHNAGAMALSVVHKVFAFGEFRHDKKSHGDISEGSIAGADVVLLRPDTFMNNSGIATKALVKSKKALEKMIVLYDDIDLPLGTIKISFNRSSGGHNGLKSISKYAGSDAYIRVRLGICPTVGATLRKPKGEAAVNKFILGNFTGVQAETFTKMLPQVVKIVEAIIRDGKDAAMNTYN